MLKEHHVMKATCKASAMAGMLGMALSTPSYASSFTSYGGGSMSGDSIVKGFANFFATVGTYGGALYLIGAVFSLILAIRNEDTEGRNKAILNMLAAIALISIGGVLTFFGITTT